MEVFLPKGTRDFLPDRMAPRLAVIGRVRDTFQRHGFLPLDTPAFERAETLDGKYGEEGSRLVFRILERGEGGREGKADLALRYDLTVPLARVVAMHGDLRLPFRRWQIAPVWRADRPAKGRYREFLQCDCDVVGAAQGVADAECLAVADAAIADLGIDGVVIRLNDRRILRALAEAVGAAERESALLVAVDKLDKIGREGVSAELAARDFPATTIAALWSAFDDAGPSAHDLVRFADTLAERAPNAGAAARNAASELARLMGDVADLGAVARIAFDATLARGLDYYTGPVWEFEAGDFGTVAAGGRYDGLIGMFSGRAIPAVGVSVGLERILLLLEARGLLPAGHAGPRVLVVAVEDAARGWAAQVASAMRKGGVPTELWSGDGRIKAAIKHAGALGATWVALIGGDEVADHCVALKHLPSATQRQLPIEDAVAQVRDGRVSD